MNHAELVEQVKLTDAERRALRIVVNGEGRAGWYQVGRVVTPTSYPEQETRPMRILNRLKEVDLIAETPGGKGHLFTATVKGVEYLNAEAGIE